MGRASLVVAAWLLVCVGVADACTSFDASSCSTGTRKKTTSVTCAANPCTESECCEKLCSSYTCPTGTVQITNAAAVPCNSASGDCNATSCCDPVCGGYTCSRGHTMTGAADKRCPKHVNAVYNNVPVCQNADCCTTTCDTGSVEFTSFCPAERPKLIKSPKCVSAEYYWGVLDVADSDKCNLDKCCHHECYAASCDDLGDASEIQAACKINDGAACQSKCAISEASTPADLDACVTCIFENADDDKGKPCYGNAVIPPTC